MRTHPSPSRFSRQLQKIASTHLTRPKSILQEFIFKQHIPSISDFTRLSTLIFIVRHIIGWHCLDLWVAVRTFHLPLAKPASRLPHPATADASRLLQIALTLLFSLFFLHLLPVSSLHPFSPNSQLASHPLIFLHPLVLQFGLLSAPSDLLLVSLLAVPFNPSPVWSLSDTATWSLTFCSHQSYRFNLLVDIKQQPPSAGLRP